MTVQVHNQFGPRVDPTFAKMREALAAFERSGAGADLGRVQEFEDYLDPANQRTYAHMYAAKQLGIWSALRTALQPKFRNNAPLVSIGAGPGLDLLGWCWDQRWQGPKYAIDPLSWNGVMRHPAWESSFDDKVGSVIRRSGHFVPGPSKPAQLEGHSGLSPWAATDCPRQSVILMSFALNHLATAGRLEDDAAAEFVSWLEGVTNRGCLVVIVDMAEERLWEPLVAKFGAAKPFHPKKTIRRFATLYNGSPSRDYRSGACCATFGAVRVLLVGKRSFSRRPVSQARVSEAAVSRGPVSRGPVSRGPVSRGPISRGPTSRGPVSRGPFSKGES